MVEIVRISACIYVILEYSRIVFVVIVTLAVAQTSIIGLAIETFCSSVVFRYLQGQQR